MIPVEAARTEFSGIPALSAISAVSFIVFSFPSAPVHALALVELISMARTGEFILSLHSFTGAAVILFTVNTPAALQGDSESISA